MYSVKDLQDFEAEIADIYKTGVIKAPVHLRASEDGSYENGMITSFRDMTKEDYFFGYWDSHIACLLKGVPRDELKAAILKGDSIALCFPKYRVLCSGIVASLMGAAVGTAWSIKNRGGKEKVYHYCGDMAVRSGQFQEAEEYAWNFNLPIVWVVGDNGVSVMTNTNQSWGFHKNYVYLNGDIRTFQYKNKYPHSGLSERVRF